MPQKNMEKEFKKQEIFVGYFLSTAIIIIISFFIFMIFRSKFFLLTNSYITYYEYGSDIKTGTVVTLNGVNVGEVKKVEIDEENRIKVFLTVLKKYKKKIRSDSVAKIVRPLLIGNKQINISAGSYNSVILMPGSIIKSEDSSELIDLISGRSLQVFIDNLGLKSDASDDAFEQVSVREIYDSAISSLVALNEFQKSLKELGISMKTFSKNIEDMSNNMNNMSLSMQNMEELSISMDNFSKEFNKLNKNLDDFEPVTKKLLPFIDKLDILAEALQNSILLRKDIEKIKRLKEK
ncbi:MAG: MCE family protein [Spirochaetes bacterium]|nr:MCE family protein [Spirochaetota bacterium]